MLFNPSPEQFSLIYDAAPCRENDTVLLFHRNEVLLSASGDSFLLPQWHDVRTLYPDALLTHAFTFANRRVLIGQVEPAVVSGSLSFQNTRIFRMLAPETEGYLLNVAYHLSVWYATHHFCGVCGGATHPAPVERALVCSQCGYTQYPVISPAVIVAVTNGDRLLLARNTYSAFRHLSLIAGYVEAGETAEQTVAREVAEETGLKVKAIRYLASQAWGFSQTLMLGFHAELDGPADIVLQASELSEAGWYLPSEIPPNDSPASIAFDIMEKFRRGQLSSFIQS